MKTLDKIFQNLKKKKKKALIAYITMGYPSLAMTENVAIALWKAGVDILELGVPFSDPIADGPTIQWSSEQALKRGARLSQLWPLVGRLKKKTGLGLVAMTYSNIVHKAGQESFFRKAKTAGLDGLILADLSVEESGPLLNLADKNNVALIQLVAPTSPWDRVRSIAQKTRGFLYGVSVTGVTGARRKVSGETIQFLKSVKKATSKPVACGFGISGPVQARRLAPYVDGIIVGSAFIEKIRSSGKKSCLPSVTALARALRQSLDRR